MRAGFFWLVKVALSTKSGLIEMNAKEMTK